MLDAGYIPDVRHFVITASLLLGCAPQNRAVVFPAGALSVDLEEIDFGEAELGAELEREILFHNSGTAGLSLVLTLEPPTAGFRLMNNSVQMGAGESVAVQIRFRPQVSLEPASAAIEGLWVETDQAFSIPAFGGTIQDVDGDGELDVRLGGLDCDDQDSTVNSTADEVWYDGLDQNCDGASDFDQDGDGADRVPEGKDCEDTDPSIQPGLPDGDSVGSLDGLDNDCDGLIDEDGLVPGDVVINELMLLPGTGNPGYVEFENLSGRTLYLDGWSFSLNGEESAWPANTEVAAGERFLVCDDDSRVSGWSCGQEWRQSVQPGAGSGSVRIGPPALLLDEVVWNSRWGLQVGSALELDGQQQDHLLNDEPSAWCSSVNEQQNGDFGTPGSENTACGGT